MAFNEIFPQGVGDINIYDMQCALLFKDEIVQADNTINIETLPAAMYFVQLKTGNKVRV